MTPKCSTNQMLLSLSKLQIGSEVYITGHHLLRRKHLAMQIHPVFEGTSRVKKNPLAIGWSRIRRTRLFWVPKANKIRHAEISTFSSADYWHKICLWKCVPGGKSRRARSIDASMRHYGFNDLLSQDPRRRYA